MEDKQKTSDQNTTEYERQMSRAELLKAQLSADSQAAGRLRPFHDIRFFIFCFMGIAVAIIATFTHLSATMRTLERRFGLTSTQTGFLASMNDIINISLVLFIGYFGKRMNKPRLLGVLTLMGGIGIFVYVIPYFIYPAQDEGPDQNQRSHLCTAPVGQNFSVSSGCSSESMKQNLQNSNAYTLFVVAAGLSGLGNSGLGILSISYIDENIPKIKSPMYIGISSAAYPLGPVFGYAFAALFLRQPENLKDSPVPSSDTSFIGCWWMPYIIYGTVLIVFSVPLFFFPKHMNHYNQEKFDRIQSQIGEKGKEPIGSDKTTEIKGPKENLKDVLQSFGKILCNGSFLVLVLSACCALFMVISLFMQMTKYLQIQFHVSPMKASLLVGGSGALTQATGVLFAGFVLRKFRVGVNGAARIFLLCFVLVSVLVGGMLPWKCTQSSLASNRPAEYNTTCNSGCSCSMDTTQPVCGDDSVLYPTPCHAGCDKVFPNKTVGGCSCSETSALLSFGLCQRDECKSHIPYLLIFSVMSFFSGFARIVAQMIQLRAVDQDLRSVGLGVASFFYNAFVFIPGPLIMGRLFDSTCLLWKRNCGFKANCVTYDMDDYRIYMHGVCLGTVGVGLLLAILLNVLEARRLKKEPTSTDLPTDSKDTGHANLAVVADQDKQDAISANSFRL